MIKEITQNYARRRAGKLKQMKFGVEIWRPSWWPEARWAWATTRHFKQNPGFPGPGKLGDFLTHCIELILQEANINVNDHVTPNPDARKLASKQRWRGNRAAAPVLGPNETISPIPSPPSSPPPVVRHPPGPPAPADEAPVVPPADGAPVVPAGDIAPNIATPSPNSSFDNSPQRGLQTIRESSPLSPIAGTSGTGFRGRGGRGRGRQQVPTPVRRDRASQRTESDTSSDDDVRSAPARSPPRTSSDRQPRRRRNSSINRDRPRTEPTSPSVITRSRSRQSGNN